MSEFVNKEYVEINFQDVKNNFYSTFFIKQQMPVHNSSIIVNEVLIEWKIER